MEVVPEMLAGRVVEIPLDLEKGSYFSGRKPEDGRIDWRLPASDIHNLIRAVAPPYPGAFFDTGSHHVEVLGSYIRVNRLGFNEPCIYFEDGNFQADCADGKRFMITHLVIDGSKADEPCFSRLLVNAWCLIGKTTHEAGGSEGRC